MLQIKHPLFLLATFTFLGAQEADTAEVSTLPAQTDTAAVAAAPEKELPTVAVLDFAVNGLPDTIALPGMQRMPMVNRSLRGFTFISCGPGLLSALRK